MCSDDSFRWTINVSRIIECELSDDDNENNSLPERITESVTFELVDQWNAMERVLLHFSHLRRETKRIGEKRYKVTIWYDRDDETEILIRILSFGSTVRVTEPARFIERLKERIKKQKEFATFFSEIITAHFNIICSVEGKKQSEPTRSQDRRQVSAAEFLFSDSGAYSRDYHSAVDRRDP